MACQNEEPALIVFKDDLAIESKLSKKIQKKDFYIIYAWTTWCGPCRNTIKEKLPVVQAYLDSTGVNVGLMAICAGDKASKSFFELHNYMMESSIESYFFESGSFSFHDRWALNGYFDKVLIEYEDSHGVPIVLLVDNKGKVLGQDPWLLASKGRLEEVIQGKASN